MYPKKVAEDTAQVLRSYLTYMAVRLIVEQLTETNPPQALWLVNYTSSHSIQDGEAYLDGLMDENKELVLRVLTVRQDLAESVLDLMPEMVKKSIVQANIDHRRRLLERLTSSTQTNDSQEQ